MACQGGGPDGGRGFVAEWEDGWAGRNVTENFICFLLGSGTSVLRHHVPGAVSSCSVSISSSPADAL